MMSLQCCLTYLGWGLEISLYLILKVCTTNQTCPRDKMQDVSASAASILTLVVVYFFLDSVIGEPKVLEYPFKQLSDFFIIQNNH